MGPVILGLTAVGAAGVIVYEKFIKKPAYQTQSVVGTGGVPLQVLTPIAPYVTPAQHTGVPTKSASPSHALAPAVAQVVPGQGTVYAPPKMVDVTSSGVVQLAPMIISPTGASSVAIGTVKDIQAALNTLGYVPRLAEDNKYGPATAKNIRAFQSKAGLVVDGNAGPATKAGLSNALAQFVSGGITATVAQQANAVVASGKPPVISTARDVQHALNMVGANPPLQEDGKPGPKTVAAIKAFQLSHGLTADGVAGPKTKAALGIAAQAPVMAGQFGGAFR